MVVHSSRSVQKNLSEVQLMIMSLEQTKLDKSSSFSNIFPFCVFLTVISCSINLKRKNHTKMTGTLAEPQTTFLEEWQFCSPFLALFSL